ncbi:enhancer of yellow 2 transcription factor-like protein B-like protein [Syncephalastrum racemosum]|uniref:Transcription and mRNA export factor SUS1 n=1 Tax=Syncephalastrum racemosum TaxID=13706 RepID=A0A1X2HDK9_SYNRA|nr:enhancer of yellow 2 transcription factor-like protein B-like protein [Syncephalastrum racemosum]
MSESDQIRDALSRHFVESGEKERLMRILKSRLAETGWTDALYAYARDHVRAQNTKNVSLDELLKETSDYGRSTVHESVKKELLVTIKRFLDAAPVE